MFRDPSVRMDLVTLPEELPVRETVELKQKLSDLHPLNYGFVHINRMLPHFEVESELPESLRPWCENFEQRRLAENESVEPLKELDMTQLHHLRFPTESAGETLEYLVASLEGSP